MAKRIFMAQNWTPGTVADGSALANNTYMALKGASGTQKTNILEVEVSGMAAASAPTPMTLARVSTLETTPTTLANPNSDGALDPATAALAAPVVTFVAATTGPSRSNAVGDAKMNVGTNAFGGILRWNAAPNQEFGMVGNTASLGEAVLSNQAYGTPGLVQSHIIYETS